jgi:hypothetical protein
VHAIADSAWAVCQDYVKDTGQKDSPCR